MSNKKKTSKKAAAKPQQQLTPKNYILSGLARKLPIAECWISSDWEEAGLCTITVARKHTTGKMTMGIYLVDKFCLGLKNTNYVFSKPDYEYEDLIETIFRVHESGKTPIDYTLAHNIIYGAIAYAEDLGFKPEKDWVFSQMILAEDTEDIELIDVEFGKDGKPFFINGPYDNTQKVINTLEKSVGKGNYNYILRIDDPNELGISDENFTFNDEDEGDDFDEDDEGENTEDVDYEEVKSKF